MLVVQMHSDTNFGLLLMEIENRWDHLIHWESMPTDLQVIVPMELHEQDETFSQLVSDLGGDLRLN
jgi:hypothetical protein